jgi:hypothetical protein
MCDFLIEYNFYQVMVETRNLFPSNEKLTRKPRARKSNRIKTPDFLQRLLQTLPRFHNQNTQLSKHTNAATHAGTSEKIPHR